MTKSLITHLPVSRLGMQKRGLESLYDILMLMRPDNSPAENHMIERMLAPLENMQVDAFGNHYLRIGTTPILWSSHTDTVHRNNGVQTLKMDFDDNISADDSDCLGADCGTGIWLMLEMIKANVEGLYIFHRSEETGGQGSKWISERTPELLDDIQYAIAFDRFGTTSIVTHQMWDRCCSEAFSESLSDALDMGHKSDSGGTFTDTANYTHLIPECTNISVGYYNQHRATEHQNLTYLIKLRDALIKADFSRLVAERDPNKAYSSYMTPTANAYYDTVDLITRYPEAVADLLYDNGLGDYDIIDYANRDWRH